MNNLYFWGHVSPARLMRTTPREWGRHLKGDWRPIPRWSSPREHGKRSAGLGFCMAQDSSPLTRGKHIMRRGWPTCPRITPRWADCHPHAYRATIPRRTHPRSRGEHTSNAIGIVSSAGSSLLTRGTHRLICANITQLRQIMEAQLNAYP